MIRRKDGGRETDALFRSLDGKKGERWDEFWLEIDKNVHHSIYFGYVGPLTKFCQVLMLNLLSLIYDI